MAELRLPEVMVLSQCGLLGLDKEGTKILSQGQLGKGHMGNLCYSATSWHFY